MTDYLDYYSSNLEGYLLGKVRANFLQIGFLSPTEFFCIIIWKANRAKSKIATKLSNHPGCDGLDDAVRKLTGELARAETPETKMQTLVEKWKFALPMASAILTILYPDEFTVYDVRVAGAIDEEKQTELKRIANRTVFADIWSGYCEFREWVKKSAPTSFSLRDKDRHLWGKSFFLQLQKDIQDNFQNSPPDPE